MTALYRCLRWACLWWRDDGALKLFMFGLTMLGVGLIAHIIATVIERDDFKRGNITIGGTYPECTLTVHRSALNQMTKLGLLKWLEECESVHPNTKGTPND